MKQRDPSPPGRIRSGDFFTTTDILAAFLQVKGHELIEIQPNGEGRVTFVFRNSEQTGRDAKLYFEDAPIPVGSLARRVARLRDACRDAKRQRPTLEKTNEGTHA